MKYVAVIVLLVKLSTAANIPQNSSSSQLDGPAEVANNVEFVLVGSRQDDLRFEMLKELPNLAVLGTFNINLPTAIFIHGWRETGKFSKSSSAIRDAYFMRGDHNAITIDWSHYSKNIYYHLAVIPQIRIISDTIAERLMRLHENGYPIDKIHLVGHSLGGQMIGKIGRQLKIISNGTLVIPRIYALDPAGPGFEDFQTEDSQPITRTDAAYVQIIHTDSGRLGMQKRVGTVDFCPNGGKNHPGCGKDTYSPTNEFDVVKCNHARAWHLYQQSVRDPKAMPAVRCLSWDDFINVENGTCYRDDIVYMGFGADTNATGKYFLETRADFFNLAKGIAGTVHNKVKVVRLETPSNKTKGIPQEIADGEYF